MPVDTDFLARRYDAIRPHLTERQRRLWLGNEARELGGGGARIVFEATGVAQDTILRGRAELDDPEPLPVGRSRGSGGGQAGRGPGAGTGRVEGGICGAG